MVFKIFQCNFGYGILSFLFPMLFQCPFHWNIIIFTSIKIHTFALMFFNVDISIEKEILQYVHFYMEVTSNRIN